jgi:phage tail-like protein
MPATPVPAAPPNPLLTYAFRVELLPPPGGAPAGPGGVRPAPVNETGGYVAGVRRVSGLTVTVAGTETWSGGNSLHRYANPFRAVWEPIVLEQGLALDGRLERWANAGIQFLRTGVPPAGEPVRRNLRLDVWDTSSATEIGPFQQIARRYLIFNAWVSKLQAVPRLDAMADEVALISVELTHHGWRLDDGSELGPAMAGEPAALPAASDGSPVALA